jgi:hypothetical protein
MIENERTNLAIGECLRGAIASARTNYGAQMARFLLALNYIIALQTTVRMETAAPPPSRSAVTL